VSALVDKTTPSMPAAHDKWVRDIMGEKLGASLWQHADIRVDIVWIQP
jgi:hypothetical protein